MKNFAYVFTIGNQIVWSGENGDRLLRRADNPKDEKEIIRFIDYCQPGDFISLSTGEMIFCIR